MRSKIFIGLVLLLSGLTFLAAGGVLAAKKARKRPPFVLPVDGAKPPEAYPGPSPVVYEGSKQPNCEDIHPTIGYEYVIQHDQFGSTYYDYQKNGSMGRMIAVGPGGHRHMIFHETRGPYPPYPRYVTYNCKDPLSNWAGPTWIDGGENKNAGYAQMLVESDGRPIALYHRTAGAPYNSCLRREDEGTICSGNFSHIWDYPDDHEPDAAGAEGMWPKGCIVTRNDTTYIHIVTTES
ncbi:MAG: hypothetical protein KAW52_08990, partial [candidate division Zixibacteria bacterium]|nr:hypothetical protein [candidate division Zixibacteria bacterium]